ncbi:hypothetical protein KY285_024587 [Solanum tuberosum]|nr:hypothetical protein KY285_024587 [Solanum tuberosum]
MATLLEKITGPPSPVLLPCFVVPKGTKSKQRRGARSRSLSVWATPRRHDLSELCRDNRKGWATPEPTLQTHYHCFAKLPTTP